MRGVIDERVLERVLSAALETGADFADVFVEESRTSEVRRTDRALAAVSDGIDAGVGVRLLFDGDVVYGYTNRFDEAALVGLARTLGAARRAGDGAGRSVPLVAGTPPGNPGPVRRDPLDAPKRERAEWLARADEAARAASTEIAQVDASISAVRRRIRIADSTGLLVDDRRTYTRLRVSAVAAAGGDRQAGTVSRGIHGGYELVDDSDPAALGREAADQAVTMLHAPYAPSGPMPVVIENGFGGVIFHEACGHLLETTAVAKKASVFTDMLGEPIASSVVSATDDGTIAAGWGSSAVDDEGMPTRRTELIRNGVLTSYLVDRVGALKTGYAPTGSGRRQSYRFAPASRMRNTFIEPGPHSRDDLLGRVDRGLYAKRMGGGSVSPGSGEFNFAVVEAYLIENGRITTPVRGATLVGTGPEVLREIEAVGSDLALADGMCGSVSGSIPAAVGQPPILVRRIVVGGRA